jgi:hypothetical protein
MFFRFWHFITEQHLKYVLPRVYAFWHTRACACAPLRRQLFVGCTGTGLTPAHICAGTGLAPAHICAGTGLAPAHICAGTALKWRSTLSGAR